MKLIYIAGKYTDETYEEIEENILVARTAAIECILLGWFPITPHLNTAHFECSLPDIPNEFYYKGDLQIMKLLRPHYDAVLMLDNWRGSIGAKIELEMARKFGLTIFYGIENVPDLTEK